MVLRRERINGLTKEQVADSRRLNGPNTLNLQEHSTFLHVVKDVVLEPMFILLMVACIIYFYSAGMRKDLLCWRRSSLLQAFLFTRKSEAETQLTR